MSHLLPGRQCGHLLYSEGMPSWGMHLGHPYTGNCNIHLCRSLNASVPAVHRRLRHAPVQVTECRRASHTRAACPPGRPLSGRMPVDSCFRAGSVDKACTACSAHCTRCQLHTCSMAIRQATHCKGSTGQLLQGHFCQLVAQAAQIYVFHGGHLCQHCQGVGGDDDGGAGSCCCSCRGDAG